MKSAVVLLLLGYLAFAQSTHIVANFGNQVIKSDIKFGDDEMVVHIHRPVNAPKNFRETTNLHIFSTHFVVSKNSREKHCYLRRFVESEDRMIGRIENAVYNNGHFGKAREERLYLDGIEPLRHRTVRILLGARIAAFCEGYAVYLLTDKEFSELDPKDLSMKVREKRAINAFVVAGHCCCGCCGCNGGGSDSIE